MSSPVRIAISMGDPAGIGPEVTLKAITSPILSAAIAPILVGDAAVWRETADRLGLSLEFRPPRQAGRAGAVALVEASTLEAATRVPGWPRDAATAAACGEAAYAAILAAARLVQDGQAAALVTAPISKAHVAAAGHDIPGHTELLAALCGGVPVRMMMAGDRLRVVLATTHMALAEVPRRLTRELILETIMLTADSLHRHFALAAPRVAVAGLNPHAGEDGRFGDEEGRLIAPAVQGARQLGVNVEGPLAADGLFAQAVNGRYDAIVCMYHDQGLGPFKLLHFADGVNFTVGLPFIRTSPDHGTAFDLAGTGQADPSSMIAALRLAARLAPG